MSPLLAHALTAPRAPAWPLGAPHPEEAAMLGPGLARGEFGQSAGCDSKVTAARG